MARPRRHAAAVWRSTTADVLVAVLATALVYAEFWHGTVPALPATPTLLALVALALALRTVALPAGLPVPAEIAFHATIWTTTATKPLPPADPPTNPRRRTHESDPPGARDQPGATGQRKRRIKRRRTRIAQRASTASSTL